MNDKLGLNPWISIWLSPRQTIRALVSVDVNYRLILMCALYGFYNMLQIFVFFDFGQTFPLWGILLSALVLSIPIGYIAVNLSSVFLFFSGKLIKGEGAFKEIRAAFYWTSVPTVTNVLLWILMMIFFGSLVFVSGFEKQIVGVGTIVVLAVHLGMLVLNIWGIVIFLHALGEVQKFSVWMALLNLFLAGIAIFLIMLFVAWGIAALAVM